MRISEYLAEGPAIALYDDQRKAFVVWRPGAGANLLRRGDGHLEPFILSREPKDATDALAVLAETVRPQGAEMRA